MRARLFAGYLLLLLAVISLVGTALDRGAFHAPIHRQWRAPSQHHGAVRLPQRNASGIPGEAPAMPLPASTAGPLFVAHPDVSSPFLAAIFVPPRA